ncbi:redoxin domain-containing protein [Halostella sp. JP-L12]|uniref:redoxin domain-containing protein n=1 Tax=Halostella TaxID=1843185 RepID=UPI0013CF1544|nr:MULTISPECIES: redoxin domain-containing protein [Halostella]NHN49942.1 redoxin domain-containing protein [Halostella sp. JP-L12]
MLSEGGTAPDFSLPGVDGRDPSYYDLHRRIGDVDAAVLAFVPSAHAPVCRDDLRALGTSAWADDEDVLVWPMTGDTVFANASAVERDGLRTPLLSDYHASIADAYGVALDDWHAHRNIPGRALFVVDPEWTVRHAWSPADPFDVPEASPFEAVAAALSELGVDAPAPDVEYRV